MYGKNVVEPRQAVSGLRHICACPSSCTAAWHRCIPCLASCMQHVQHTVNAPIKFRASRISLLSGCPSPMAPPHMYNAALEDSCLQKQLALTACIAVRSWRSSCHRRLTSRAKTSSSCTTWQTGRPRSAAMICPSPIRSVQTVGPMWTCLNRRASIRTPTLRLAVHGRWRCDE